MTPRFSVGSIWIMTGALALVVAALLVRNVTAISAHVPLDPNEGWNAAHALSIIAGHDLYPRAQTLMINNYPPLSFYVIAAIAKQGGDVVIAGRWLSLAAYASITIGIALVLKRMDCSWRAIMLGALFFAAVLLIASDYVGMDDPQLLGQAVQLGALLLLLNGATVVAALLFCVSLFVKHNLIAMPVAATLWLLLLDRDRGMAFLLWSVGFGLLGLLIFRLSFGTGLINQLQTPRLMSFTNLRTALAHLWWAPIPLLALWNYRLDRYGLFCALYGLAGLLLGLIFSMGDGVDANAFFDLAIALSMGLGLVVERGQKPLLAAIAAAPLLIYLSINFDDNNFSFTQDFARQSARDIAFLKGRTGPALCDQLSLCLWAGKQAEVDVFNIGEAIKTGARDPAPLASMIAHHHFSTLQMIDIAELGPALRRSILKNYRVDHSDDNGVFLIPLTPEP